MLQVCLFSRVYVRTYACTTVGMSAYAHGSLYELCFLSKWQRILGFVKFMMDVSLEE